MKKRILWVCNTLLPEACEKLGVPKNKPESWIEGIYRQLSQSEEYSLIYLFPNPEKCSTTIGNTTFVSYRENRKQGYSKAQVGEFEAILKEYQPDIIHLFGTEYPHSYAMAQAAGKVGFIDRVVMNIQGLSLYIAMHHDAYLPQKVVRGITIKDIVRGNVASQKRDFRKRGMYEEKTIRMISHVIGRTDWDRACVERLNPKIHYHTCNETLRPAFYGEGWSLGTCERHSIMVSQCAWPLKGFHLMLEALADLVKDYPDVYLYTTGTSPLSTSFHDRIRRSYYHRYLGRLMRKYGLEDHVSFLGYLNEEEMYERLRKCHVFANCSSIENESNSLSEAKILGVPAVVSYVGGVTNRLVQGVDGYTYPADEPYMLAYYIRRIFEDDELAQSFSTAGKENIAKIVSPEENYQTLLKIYESM